MSERTLLLRCAAAWPFVVLGTDYPSARVFDTTTSALVAVVELPARQRTALSSVTLTSVALGTRMHDTAADNNNNDNNNNNNDNDNDGRTSLLMQTSCHAAVGLSNGTVLLHDVTQNALCDHVAVSNHQRAVVAMTFCAHYLLCLSDDRTLHVIDAAQPALGVRVRTRVTAEASALAAVVEKTSSTTTTMTLRVVVAGPSTTVLRLHMPARGAAVRTAASSSATLLSEASVVERVLSFASHGTSVDFVWLGSDSDSGLHGNNDDDGVASVAVTANAQDGAVQVWDVSGSGGSASAHAASTTSTSRCRRTLLCGQRIANVSVHVPRSHNNNGNNDNDAKTMTTAAATTTSADTSNSSGGVAVVASTYTGVVYVWHLGQRLLPRHAEPVPLMPTLQLVSAAPSARLLYSFALPQPSSCALQLLLLRGRFALPRFDVVCVDALLADADAHARTRAAKAAAAAASSAHARNDSTAAAAVGSVRAARVLRVPLSAALTQQQQQQQQQQQNDSHVDGDAASSAFAIMDTVWATHRNRVAAKSALTPTESFALARTHHARSTDELPVRQLTLEQRLRQLRLDAAHAATLQNAVAHATAVAAAAQGEEDNDDDTDDDDDVVGDASHDTHALGLATVPLYQALHANDAAAVMELLSLAARSSAGMRATVLSLQLPYCLQLLSMLSTRLGICSTHVAHATTTNNDDNNDHTNAARTMVGAGLAAVSLRSPLLAWIDCIVHYRGMELYAAQQQQQHDDNNDNDDATTTTAAATRVSSPRDFLAPILHQYRSTCAQYDKLATLYGRLSVFDAARPSRTRAFFSRSRRMLCSNLEQLPDHTATMRVAGATTTKTTSRRRVHAEQAMRRVQLDLGGVMDDDLAFPVMFAEVRTRRGGLRAVRVRSRTLAAQARRRRATRPRALRAHATRLANARGGGDAAANDIDGDNDSDAAMDLDDMRLDSSSGSSHDDDDDDDVNVARGDKRRRDDDDDDDRAMLADEASGDDDDDDTGNKEGGHTARAHDVTADLDSSDEAEFASASDDDDDDDVASSDDSDNDSHDSDDDGSGSDASSGDGDDDVAVRTSDDDDDDDDGGDDESDDGMGEDMRALLDEHATAQDRLEARKQRRIRRD